MDTLQDFQKAISKAFIKRSGRMITFYTGTGGYDLVNEIMEKQVLGTERVYIGKKVPRILRKLKIPIFKSASGRYYKRVKA